MGLGPNRKSRFSLHLKLRWRPGRAATPSKSGFNLTWQSRIIEVQRISDTIILLKMILARLFSPSYKCTHLKWVELVLKRNVFMTSCNALLPRFQPSRYLPPVVDWNCHAGTAADVYSDARGGHGFGIHNTEGERILEKPDTHSLPMLHKFILYKASTTDTTQLRKVVR